MAEIKIEQKKQTWPWVLVGLVLVALLLYFLVFRDNDKTINTTREVTDTNYVTPVNQSGPVGVNNNSSVVAFVSFVDNDRNRDSLNHAYINEAFSKLTAATNAKAREIGYDIQTDWKKVEESTALITRESFDTSQARNIRNAADNSTTALQNMQRAKYPGLASEVNELRSASASINPETLTLNQNDAVKNYFAKASDLLKKMN